MYFDPLFCFSFKLKFISSEDGRLLKRTEPRKKNTPLLIARLKLALRVCWCLHGIIPTDSLSSELFLNLGDSFSWKYFGWPQTIALWIVISVVWAVSWWTERSPDDLVSSTVGVLNGFPVFILSNLLCRTCNLLLSAFENALNLLTVSLYWSWPQVFPNNC